MPVAALGRALSDAQLLSAARLVLPAWALIAVAPGWRGTRAVALAAAAALAAAYCAALVEPVQRAGSLSAFLEPFFHLFWSPSFASYDGVVRLFESEAIAAISWLHFAAVDLLLGWGLAADAEVRGVSGTAIAAQALVSMMFAPAGLLLYLLVTRPLLSAPSARRRAAGRGAKRD